MYYISIISLIWVLSRFGQIFTESQINLMGLWWNCISNQNWASFMHYILRNNILEKSIKILVSQAVNDQSTPWSLTQEALSQLRFQCHSWISQTIFLRKIWFFLSMNFKMCTKHAQFGLRCNSSTPVQKLTHLEQELPGIILHKYKCINYQKAIGQLHVLHKVHFCHHHTGWLAQEWSNLHWLPYIHCVNYLETTAFCKKGHSCHHYTVVSKTDQLSLLLATSYL